MWNRVGICVFALMVSVGAAGCGGGNNGSGASDHVFFDNLPKDIGASGHFEGTFSLPSNATVTYSVTNTGASTTSWNVGIAPASELPAFEADQMWQAYAPHNDVSTISDSASVPAGDYALALRCTNIVNDCSFTFSVDAVF